MHTKQILRGVTVAVALAVSAILAPAASAYPGDPMPGCITQMGSVLCDGPIRPDGTFQRCWSNPGSFTPGRYGGYIPPMTNCEIVDLDQPWPMIPFGAPQHHIDQ